MIKHWVTVNWLLKKSVYGVKDHVISKDPATGEDQRSSSKDQKCTSLDNESKLVWNI